jgi:hypothetical protein
MMKIIVTNPIATPHIDDTEDDVVDDVDNDVDVSADMAHDVSADMIDDMAADICKWVDKKIQMVHRQCRSLKASRKIRHKLTDFL